LSVAVGDDPDAPGRLVILPAADAARPANRALRTATSAASGSWRAAMSRSAPTGLRPCR